MTTGTNKTEMTTIGQVIGITDSSHMIVTRANTVELKIDTVHMIAIGGMMIKVVAVIVVAMTDTTEVIVIRVMTRGVDILMRGTFFFFYTQMSIVMKVFIPHF